MMKPVALCPGIRQKQMSIYMINAGDVEQLRFVFSDDKKIIVTAPAGCGKTTAMVSKIAWELSSGHILSNKKVLAMTFSVNAAMKIKDALKTLLPNLVENVQQYISKVDVANYHNFAMRILFKHGYSLNPEFVHLSEFKIVDESSHYIDSFITSADSDKLKKVDEAVKISDKERLIAGLDDYWEILNKMGICNYSQSMEKRTLAVQVTEELFQRVKWAVTKEGIKQKDFIIRIIEKAVEEVEAKWKELEQPEENAETDRLEEAKETAEDPLQFRTRGCYLGTYRSGRWRELPP